MAKIKCTKKLRITKENHRNQAIPVIFGGDYWTRTSGLMRVNIKMSGLAALGSQGHGHTWFLLRRFQLDRNDGRAVHIVELAAGIVIELDEV